MVVNGGEVLDDVAVEGVAVLARPGVALVERLVRPLAHTAGGVGADEAGLPDGLYHLAQRVVPHEVVERRSADQPRNSTRSTGLPLSLSPVCLHL